MKLNYRWICASLTVSSIAVGTLLSVPVAQAAGSRAIPAYSVRLEDQLLATLRYLPVKFKPYIKSSTPTTTTTTTTTTLVGTTTTSSTTTLPTNSTTTTTSPKVSKPTKPTNPTKLTKGSYVWRFAALPASFKSQWSVGTNNVILHAALMRFQVDHGLAATGSMTFADWTLLVHATLKREMSPSSYNVVYVTKALPQRVKLYQNGRVTFSALVNTGISVAPTASGTYPVYLRYTTTTMSGTNPNGTHYHDTGIPWVSYFNGGDALHGFIRSTYGWPQSLGCVEMPFVDAAALWPHTPIGTLVTVR